MTLYDDEIKNALLDGVRIKRACWSKREYCCMGWMRREFYKVYEISKRNKMLSTLGLTVEDLYADDWERFGGSYEC